MRIDTAKLCKLLDDLTHTASAYESGGILLHTVRGWAGEEVGETDLLVGTSTNRFVVGHTYTEAYGQLARPMLWRLSDAKAVIAAYKPRLTTNKEHAVELRFDGDHIVVHEDLDLFGEGFVVRFDNGDLSKYPRNIWQVVAQPPAVADDAEPISPRSDLPATSVEPFVKVAKSRGEKLQLYRYHQQYRCLVQIGDRYRGAINVSSGWDVGDGLGAEPAADVHPAPLPAVDDATASE